MYVDFKVFKPSYTVRIFDHGSSAPVFDLPISDGSSLKDVVDGLVKNPDVHEFVIVSRYTRKEVPK